jgi:crotonobetaine/carnitine-CoA ligase
MHEIDFSDTGNRRLGTILALHAAAIGDQPFLLAEEQSYSYREVNSRVNQLAHGLRARGVGAGHRVIFFLNSSVDFVFLALACSKVGAIWVPINTDYRGDWLRETIADSHGSILITETALLPRLLEVREQLVFGPLVVMDLEWGKEPAGTLGLADLISDDSSEPDMGHIHYGDTCAVMWTSGTTGKAKGVMQSHNVWVRAAIHNNRNFELRAGDVAYNCLPLYNSASWVANVYRALVGGIACAIDPMFSVHDFWDRLRHYGATQTMTLGAMHMFLWKQPPRDDDADNPLRMANMVPMPEPLLKPFCERFGIEGNLQGFGQSEVMLLLSRKDMPDRQWKPNALGELGPGIELKMVNTDGITAASGEVGEFCVRQNEPHQIFNGYFENPEAEAAAYVDGWYHTGDLGICDADGDYFFVDRKKDIIRFKGRNVSSVQIEGIVMQHPTVQSAAVYAIKSDELDSEDEIKLDVVLNQNAAVDASELARFVNDNAPYFCVPRYIEFVRQLPFTPTNKVQKYKLREQPLKPEVWDRVSTDFELVR